ncbi:MAG TPA: DAK2 domain-containing protein [Candidatus Dormibacteraeota bacterium]|nr:DAK2 domain-containing protein [Candidatus Dormibacteraeota bacterium]
MRRRGCDGEGLLRAFAAAVEHVSAHVEEINALNVFPVPDGDTGSNMAATVRAALDEAERVPPDERTLERVGAAIAFGSLMGARGNSGVILSQIFRGMASGLEGKRHLNGLDLAHALTRGTETAYAAVVRPVEGTILTVIREAAVAAVESAERDADLERVLAAAVVAAERAVARTPSLLPILREAGVVDAGGQGLYRVLEGGWRFQRAGRRRAAPAGAVTGPGAPSTIVPRSDAVGGFGFETMFLVQAPDGGLDLEAIRGHLEGIGESVLVAGDARAAKVHVHSPRPDQVIAFGLSLGTVSRVSVENLDDQARDVREARASAFAGEAPVLPPAEERSTEAAELPIAVIAVASGSGLVRAFEGFGVQAVVEGGQSANPSTGELLRALQQVPARQVMVLPNNPNVRLAAEQAAALCPERAVAVVPTRNAAEGIAALLAVDPAGGASANAGPMEHAGRAIQSFLVTEAIRDATVSGRKVKRGQAMALDPDDGLLAVAEDAAEAVLGGLCTLAPGFGIVSLWYGSEATLGAAEELARRIHVEFAALEEVEVRRGGQPHYRYLLSAE